MIPFDFPWWLWILLSLGFGWIAAVMSDTNWGGGSGQFIANALRLIFVLVCVLCAIAGVVLLTGGY